MVSRYSYQVEIKGGPRDVDANKTLLPDAQSPTSTPESTRNVKKKLSKTHSPLSSKGDHRLPDDVPTWHSGSPQWPQQEYVPPPPPQQPPPLQQQQQQQHHQPLPELPPPQPRWATVNPPAQPLQPPPIPSSTTSTSGPRSNGISILHTPTTTTPLTNRSPLGWATINPQRPQPVPPPRLLLSRLSSTTTHSRPTAPA